MLRYIFIFLAIYLGYKLIFDIIVPVFKTTRKIRQQFGAMNQHMQEQMSPKQAGQEFANGQSNTQHKKASPGDYIDFEEVK